MNKNIKGGQLMTRGHSDNRGSSRDTDSSTQDETRGPTDYHSFPTLPSAPSPSGPRSPSLVQSDLASDTDIDAYSSVVYARDNDYNSDAGSTTDSHDNLDIVHTLDREEYGLQYVLLTNSKWYIYHDRRKISRMLPDEHEDFLAWMADPDAKPATTISD